MSEAPTKPDRKLGDEWTDWSGDLEDSQKGKRLFSFLLFLAYVFILLLLGLLYYMSTPRLAQWHPELPRWIGLGGSALVLIISVWSGLFIASLLFQRNMLGPLLPPHGLPEGWARLAGQLGGYLGFTRDGLGNSFLKLHNTHIKLRERRRAISGDDLLVLLPRCLDRPTREKINSLKQELGLRVHTVGGGDAARELVQKIRPRAIIAVACERDLIAGIQDVDSRLPVIGIPNHRPEGPCKNTWIDVAILENNIRFFLSGTS